MSHRLPTLQIVAALASIGAAAVHVTVAADHWTTWWGYGMQFVAAAAIQLGWGIVAMMRRGRALLGVGVALQAVFIGAWVVTRTLGQPIGPDAGVAEPVGTPGVLTVLLELTTIVAALLATTTRSAATPARSHYIARIGTGGVVVLAATSVAVLTAITGGHHSGGGHHGDGGHQGPANQDTPSRERAPSGTGHHRPTPSHPAEAPSSPAPSPSAGDDGHSHNHG